MQERARRTDSRPPRTKTVRFKALGSMDQLRTLGRLSDRYQCYCKYKVYRYMTHFMAQFQTLVEGQYTPADRLQQVLDLLTRRALYAGLSGIHAIYRRRVNRLTGIERLHLMIPRVAVRRIKAAGKALRDSKIEKILEAIGQTKRRQAWQAVKAQNEQAIISGNYLRKIIKHNQNNRTIAFVLKVQAATARQAWWQLLAWIQTCRIQRLFAKALVERIRKQLKRPLLQTKRQAFAQLAEQSRTKRLQSATKGREIRSTWLSASMLDSIDTLTSLHRQAGKTSRHPPCISSFEEKYLR